MKIFKENNVISDGNELLEVVKYRKQSIEVFELNSDYTRATNQSKDLPIIESQFYRVASKVKPNREERNLALKLKRYNFTVLYEVEEVFYNFDNELTLPDIEQIPPNLILSEIYGGIGGYLRFVYLEDKKNSFIDSLKLLLIQLDYTKG